MNINSIVHMSKGNFRYKTTFPFDLQVAQESRKSRLRKGLRSKYEDNDDDSSDLSFLFDDDDFDYDIEYLDDYEE